jgi:hypothetical protein
MTITARLLIAILAIAGVVACSPAPTRARRPLGLSLPALDGGVVDLGSYRGRVIVVHCFTTWSMAAQLDIEQLVSVHTAYDENVIVIGVALDPNGYQLVSPWRKATRAPYLIALAGDVVRAGDSSLGRIAEVPTTLVIARDGTVAKRIIGPLRAGQLDSLIARLLP